MEQAEESVPLQDFVFPSKTLLLLGKEREGVPVELLNQVSFFCVILSPYIHIAISGWWLCRDSSKWACSLVQRPRHWRRCPLGGGEAVVQALEELLWCVSAFLSSLRPIDIPWRIQGVKNCCNSIVGICSRSFFQILVYKGHHITSWQGVCQDRRGKKLNSIQMACPRGKYIVFVSFV